MSPKLSAVMVCFACHLHIRLHRLYQTSVVDIEMSMFVYSGQSTGVQTVSGSFNPPRAFLPLGGPGPALTPSFPPSPSSTYGPISGGNGPIYLMPGKPYNPNLRISGNRNVPSIQRYPQDEMIGGSNNMRNSICTEVCMPSCTPQCIASSPIVPVINQRPGTIIMGEPGPVIPQGAISTQGGLGPVVSQESFPFQSGPGSVIPQRPVPIQGGFGLVIPQRTVPIQGEPGVVIESDVIRIQSSTAEPNFMPNRQSGLIRPLSPIPEFVPYEIPNQPRLTQCIPSKTHIQCVCPKNYIICSNNNQLNQCCRK
ncbi:unnamed protein product [Anisakis simplex]|uniref:EB domain-containing protein n=1 Tax=Anisakis simplex TaxID=6269 RepID=A0A0M3IZN5_ANISI|nr:unnamed protein product [Anisakis simplex]